MKKKLLVVGVLAITCLLLMTQAFAVYGAKQAGTYFYSQDGHWQIADSSFINNADGKIWMIQQDITGDLSSGMFGGPTFGTFTCVRTAVLYYDRAGTAKYAQETLKVVITPSSGSGTITLDVKFKFDFGVPPEFQRVGSWVIVGGTGDYAQASGRGDYKWMFQFYGTINWGI